MLMYDGLYGNNVYMAYSAMTEDKQWFKNYVNTVQL